MLAQSARRKGTPRIKAKTVRTTSGAWQRQLLKPSQLCAPLAHLIPQEALPSPQAYLLHVKLMELVCDALKLSGNLYFCTLLPLPFGGWFTQGQAGREREAIAGIACKDRGPTF